MQYGLSHVMETVKAVLPCMEQKVEAGGVAQVGTALDRSGEESSQVRLDLPLPLVCRVGKRQLCVLVWRAE